MTIKLMFQMACILRLECNFCNGYFRCMLPVEMVDVEVKVKMMQGTYMFQRNRTSQIIKCAPWSTRLHPYPSLIQKMKTSLELEGNLVQSPGPNPKPSCNKPVHNKTSQNQPNQAPTPGLGKPQDPRPMTKGKGP